MQHEQVGIDRHQAGSRAVFLSILQDGVHVLGIVDAFHGNLRIRHLLRRLDVPDVEFGVHENASYAEEIPQKALYHVAETRSLKISSNDRPPPSRSRRLI